MAFLMLIALFFLPISLSEAHTEGASSAPVWFLISLYVITLGLPFLINAATAPLLQKWFSTTDHPHAQDPYFLYAASNAGSLLALIAYVIFIEPEIGLVEQSTWWTNGFILLTVMVIAFGAYSHYVNTSTKNTHMPPKKNAAETENAPPLDWHTRLRWCLYAFIPSSLLLATTLYITTDVTAIPLLWVVPLMLYLLTFVICFARRRLFSDRFIIYAHTAIITLYAFLAFAGSIRGNIFFLFLSCHACAFFISTGLSQCALSRASAS